MRGRLRQHSGLEKISHQRAPCVAAWGWAGRPQRALALGGQSCSPGTSWLLPHPEPDCCLRGLLPVSGEGSGQERAARRRLAQERGGCAHKPGPGHPGMYETEDPEGSAERDAHLREGDSPPPAMAARAGRVLRARQPVRRGLHGGGCGEGREASSTISSRHHARELEQTRACALGAHCQRPLGVCTCAPTPR